MENRPTISCTSTLTFEAAHRIAGHSGHCKYLHGHRYVCSFTFTADKTNELGMIIDFSEIKQVLHKWVKDNLDHNAILHDKDVELIEAIERCTNQRIYKLKAVPTVENLALHFLDDICPKLFKGHTAHCIKVEIEETEVNKGKAEIVV